MNTAIRPVGRAASLLKAASHWSTRHYPHCKKSFAIVVSLYILTALTPASPPDTSPRGQWTVDVKGMSCPLCANNIEKQIRRVIPDATVKIDLGTGSVEVRSNSSPLDAALKIRRAVISAGFTPGEVSPAQ